MEEVAGVAEGAGLSFDAAFFAGYRDGWDGSAAGEGCTSFVRHVSEGEGGPGVFIGQTKDTGEY
jgi:hypothetical protein